jgi:hypothetical protein
MPTKRKPNDRVGIIQAISTPLGFYVLSLLIIESTLAIVLTCSKLTEEHIWIGFKMMRKRPAEDLVFMSYTTV